MRDYQKMFQQLRQMKLTQDDLKKEVTRVESGRMSVVVNGELQIVGLGIPNLSEEERESLMELLNDGFTQAKEKIMIPIKKMANSGTAFKK